jgi:hypothetical protein
MSQLPPPVRTGRPATQQQNSGPQPFAFRPASKTGRKARLSIQGMSGSGKTWTGLSIAHGLSRGEKFAVIDTEKGAASLYAGHRGIQFDSCPMDRYDPRDLIRVLDSAAQAGYPTVFVDSLSHFWKGTDGTLDQVEKASSRYGGNKFAGSMRSYTEWVLNGGKPERVGTRPEQRKGIEYEFDVAVAMDLDNRLEVLKSRCPALHRKVIETPNGARDIAGPLLAWLDAEPEPTTEQ